MTFELGDATALEAHGGDFDLVTCQTVLIHLADPARAIVDMAARLRPGGLVAVAEPNNLVETMVTDSLDVEVSMEERIEWLRFQWICETGKRNLGQGDNSLGDRVPELFARAGLVDVQVYNSDKVSLLMPPYGSVAQQALRDNVFEHEHQDFAGWDRATAEQYFLAGGGDLRAFEEAWRRARMRVRETARALREERFYANSTGVFYLVSGRVPLTASRISESPTADSSYPDARPSRGSRDK
jgi:SAM-dependent methyltransferase